MLINLHPARKAFLGVTAHWCQKGAIEYQVVLTSAVVGFRRICGSHNGMLRHTISACVSNVYSSIADNLAATLLFVLDHANVMDRVSDIYSGITVMGIHFDSTQIGRITMDSATANSAMMKKFQALCIEKKMPLRADFSPRGNQVHCLSHAVNRVCTKVMAGFGANAPEDVETLHVENSEIVYNNVIMKVSYTRRVL